MTGTLNDFEIDQLLHSQIIGRIGCHSDDVTYVVPVSYAYDGKYLYGYSEEGMKLNMMRKNPEVCFQTDTLPHMDRWRSVVCWGRFEELTSEEERRTAVHHLMSRIYPIVASKRVKLSDEWPFHSSDMTDIKGVLYRIELTKKTGKYEQS